MTARNGERIVGTTMIAGIGEIAGRFDHVLVDQWGVLHAGDAVFPAARDCLARLREAGKRVLVLSNSGKRAADNVRRIAELGLAPGAYDGVLSSGEATWTGLRDRLAAPFQAFGRNCYLVTRGNDRSVVAGLSLTLVTAMADADFILLGGLDDAMAEPVRWHDAFAAAVARDLPMLCANPDITMFGAKGFIPGPGALARSYEGLGGRVDYVGKPHPPIFAAALRQLGDPAPGRVLMVGDSLEHDILGGRRAGMLTALVTSGVHQAALEPAADLPLAIRDLAGAAARVPHWAMERLAW